MPLVTQSLRGSTHLSHHIRVRTLDILSTPAAAAAAAKLLQSCPTLCDPMDCSPPGSSVHGIFQARVLLDLVILLIIDSHDQFQLTAECHHFNLYLY